MDNHACYSVHYRQPCADCGEPTYEICGRCGLRFCGDCKDTRCHVTGGE